MFLLTAPQNERGCDDVTTDLFLFAPKDLTNGQRSSFTSVDQLEETIMDYIDSTNESPKPFIWTATAKDILEKVARARAVLDNL